MAQGVMLSVSLRTFAPGRLNLKTRMIRRVYAGINKVLDLSYGGLYGVFGTVAVAGTPDVPVQRVVRLMYKKNGRIIRQMMSEADGNYAFRYIIAGPWFVIAHDHTGEYNAVISDNILAEHM